MTAKHVTNSLTSSVPVVVLYKVYLTQGFVLAPLLYLFYVINLASSLNDAAVIALYADDASILTTAYKKEDSEIAAQ